MRKMMELLTEFVKRLGYLWYIMDPRDHMFSKVEDVPDYYKEITPAYIFLIILEQIIHLLRGRKMMRLNDSVTNICQGILMELFKIPLHGIELIVYTWVYNHWRIFTFPWDSVWTWMFCMVAADFCFYWMHKMLHQISILWAFHETHHSSEEFNLTIPLRLSLFHNASLWFTYVPLALAIPPSVFLVHYQLSVILQFWLHTEVIKSVGILEYIIVTPSHHRVHHGRNRRCIDKNFGSVFILWDRFFGTFEPEGEEPISYGVTKPLQTFNPVTIQLNHLQTIWRRLKSEKGVVNKLSSIFKGPGWSSGNPWTGNIEDIPEPTAEETKYDPNLPGWLKFYIVLHTSALVIGHLQMILNLPNVSTSLFALCSCYMILTIVGLGYLLDLSTWGPTVELLRCFLYLFVDAAVERQFGSHYVLLSISLYSFRCLFLSSFVFWIFAHPLAFLL